MVSHRSLSSSPYVVVVIVFFDDIVIVLDAHLQGRRPRRDRLPDSDASSSGEVTNVIADNGGLGGRASRRIRIQPLIPP